MRILATKYLWLIREVLRSRWPLAASDIARDFALKDRTRCSELWVKYLWLMGEVSMEYLWLHPWEMSGTK